jgi:hypothetical protein
MDAIYKKSNLLSTVIPLDSPVKGEDDKIKLKETVRQVRDRANNLLPGKGTEVPEEAVEYIVKVNVARANTIQNPWYRFISLVSGLSTEPMSKMWKKQEDVEKTGFALFGETNTSVFSAIDAAADNYDGSALVSRAMRSQEKNVADYVKNRRDFLNSPEVYGKLYLTPLIFAHINEAQQLIQNLCHVSLDLNEFIKSTHATYFARLVSLRMNMSRFLGGRYYHLNNNYGRLQQQTTKLLAYFKQKLSSSNVVPSMVQMYPNRLNQHLVNQSLQEDQCLLPLGASLSQAPMRHSYFEKLNQL